MGHARTSRALALAAGLAMAAPVAEAADPPKPASEGDNTIGGAIAQPARDLNVMREKIPPPLAIAASAPYLPPADCQSADTEIAQLTRVLGGDIDAPDTSNGDNPAEAAVAGAVRSAIGLPFRGVIRRLSGAEKRDQTFRAAVMAGMVRRGYLRGVRAQMNCDAPTAVAASEPEAALPPDDPAAAPLAASAETAAQPASDIVEDAPP
jgi:hypothetical protein